MAGLNEGLMDVAASSLSSDLLGDVPDKDVNLLLGELSISERQEQPKLEERTIKFPSLALDLVKTLETADLRTWKRLVELCSVVKNDHCEAKIGGITLNIGGFESLKKIWCGPLTIPTPADLPLSVKAIEISEGSSNECLEVISESSDLVDLGPSEQVERIPCVPAIIDEMAGAPKDQTRTIAGLGDEEILQFNLGLDLNEGDRPLRSLIGYLNKSDPDHVGWRSVVSPILYLSRFSMCHGDMVGFGHISSRGLLAFARDHSKAAFWGVDGNIIPGKSPFEEHIHCGPNGPSVFCNGMESFSVSKELHGEQGDVFRFLVPSPRFLADKCFLMDVLCHRVYDFDQRGEKASATSMKLITSEFKYEHASKDKGPSHRPSDVGTFKMKLMAGLEDFSKYTLTLNRDSTVNSRPLSRADSDLLTILAPCPTCYYGIRSVIWAPSTQAPSTPKTSPAHR
ncbi:unnamed protein product, partial [Notodromas monacha]